MDDDGAVPEPLIERDGSMNAAENRYSLRARKGVST